MKNFLFLNTLLNIVQNFRNKFFYRKLNRHYVILCKTIEALLGYEYLSWEFDILLHFCKHIDFINTKQNYEKLIANCDGSYIEDVDSILLNIKLLQTQCTKNKLLPAEKRKALIECYKKYAKNIKKFNDNSWCFKDKYFLPCNSFEYIIFEKRYYLDSINLNYIKNKNIIDAGAYIGDSAIIFSEYTNKNVYAFEPVKENYDKVVKTIELNKTSNIIPINKALGNKNEILKTTFNGSSTSVYKKFRGGKEIECEITTLDDFIKENNIQIGLIKTDIEGSEKLFLEGAKETITKQRPILILSIYHSINDFFEIKPLIESWNLNYKFRIVKPTDGKIIIDTVLICEPKL